MTTWGGVFPAVTTKLRQDGSIDLKATQASLDTPLSCAVSGGAVYVVEGGGTGTIRVVTPGGPIATLSRR